MNQDPDNETPKRSYLPTVTSSMKWWLAIVLGLLFFVVSSPLSYRLTNSIWNGLKLPGGGLGSPTLIGSLLHAVVFAIIIRILIW